MTQLSAHFTLEELIYSDTARAKGISNNPTATHLTCLKHTALYLLEPLRTLLNAKYKIYNGKQVDHVGLRITSGYRSPALNAAVKGSSTSQHCQGCAVDCEAVIYFKDKTKTVLPYTTLYEDVKAWVKAGNISVDQAIEEKSGAARWVHLSHSSAGRTRDRRQFLKFDGVSYKLDVDLP